MASIFTDRINPGLQNGMDDILNQQTLELKTVHNQSIFVGRQSELQTLLDLGETVMAGLGRVAVVVGEPGIGKSRLIQQWKEKFNNTHPNNFPLWINAKTITFDEDLAFNLLKVLFRAIIHSLTPDQPKIDFSYILKFIVEKHHLLTDMQGSVLALLLDNPFEDEKENFIQQPSAQDLQNQYKNTLKVLLSNLAKKQPLIIVLEDLQWADRSSINLLAEVIPLIRSLPILLCLVSRDERKSNGWQLVSASRNLIGQQCIEINLEKLEDDESLSLIRQLTEFHNIFTDTVKVILEKSEGNPFFIEELVQMVLGNETTQENSLAQPEKKSFDLAQIPDSLQALIAARLDRLEPDAVLTLQVASVIGRSFSLKLLDDSSRTVPQTAGA